MLNAKMYGSIYNYNYNCGGKRLGSPYQYICWTRGPVQGRTPPRLWEEPLLGQVWPRTKGTVYY